MHWEVPSEWDISTLECWFETHLQPFQKSSPLFRSSYHCCWSFGPSLCIEPHLWHNWDILVHHRIFFAAWVGWQNGALQCNKTKIDRQEISGQLLDAEEDKVSQTGRMWRPNHIKEQWSFHSLEPRSWAILPLLNSIRHNIAASTHNGGHNSGSIRYRGVKSNYSWGNVCHVIVNSNMLQSNEIIANSYH